MAEAGFEKTAEQCREKAKKLKAEYRKVKDQHKKTGQGREKWKFLEAMDAVLADKPATRPPVLIDTLDQESEVDCTIEQEQISRDESEDQEMSANCLAGKQDDSEGSKAPAAGRRSATPTEKKGKKRNREEKMEKH